ncbi:MAG: hypothetical protein ACFUZC_13445 [Chthoniobacteraceae bacterium]
MALHLNFYHEIHKQAVREARDPFKIAGLVALIIGIMATGWYFYRMSAVSKLEGQRQSLQAAWAKVEPDLKRAESTKAAVVARQKSNKLLIERLRGRFYWAPVLERLVDCTGPNVQLLSVAGELTEPENVKSISLSLKGVAAGEQARTAAEAFRKTLQEKLTVAYGSANAVFDSNSLEDAAETVNLNGQTLGMATFRIRVKFNIAAPAASPSPAPSSKGAAK